MPSPWDQYKAFLPSIAFSISSNTSSYGFTLPTRISLSPWSINWRSAVALKGRPSGLASDSISFFIICFPRFYGFPEYFPNASQARWINWSASEIECL